MVLSSTPGGGGSNCAFTRAERVVGQIGPFVENGDHSPSLTTRAPDFSAALVSTSFRLRAVRRRPHQARMQQAGKHEVARRIWPCR